MHNFILGRKEKSKETQVTVELKQKKKRPCRLIEKIPDHTVILNF